ncbi:MAG TPA: putative glycolipid-binding domain-containing protein [Longimicrobiaceae bacterium]
MSVATILWRRVDRPGHESARVFREGGLWRLHGAAVFAHAGAPVRLDYAVVCDAEWRTVSASVAGWVGEETVAAEVAVDAEGRWRLNGAECPQVAGCVDVDLNFSPSTNLLPIRRLGLRPGEEGAVRAAWLRFPGFTLEPLEQRYRRVEEGLYRYESGGGAFTTDLRVDGHGLVTRYPGGWEAVS